MNRNVNEEGRYIRTIGDGLSNGLAIKSLTRSEWNLARTCERPVHRESEYLRRPRRLKVFQENIRHRTSETPLRVLELETRCRKCPRCLQARAAYWRKRAESELGQTRGRTWFGTLTLSPDSHFKALCAASLRLAAQGTNFDDLDSQDQFLERHREIGREITLWLKRVRKESGIPLRFFLTAEAHKSGLPHYHILVHEASPDAPLRAKVLRTQWKLGFTRFNLVAEGGERRSAAYVAKYLSKSASARVRASAGYGHPAPLVHQPDTTSSRHSNSSSVRDRHDPNPQPFPTPSANVEVD